MNKNCQIDSIGPGDVDFARRQQRIAPDMLF
jgi:hypothetical protein